MQEHEIPAISRAFPSEYGRTFLDDWKDQEQGILSVYAAWVCGSPVAYGLIRWSGPRREIVANEYPDCPEVYRVFVPRWYRRMGIAHQLMNLIERDAKTREYQQIGLGVGIKSEVAQKLYAKSGYEKSALPPYTESYQREELDGSVSTFEGQAIWMVKQCQAGTNPADH